MPISRKRFSFSKNKKSVKKSLKVKKNTRKNKKTTPRRKHKKSGKRFRFFGGNGNEDICAICFLPLSDNTNGEIFETNCKHNFHRGCIEEACAYQANRQEICTCPLCRSELNPNPNTNSNRRRSTPVELPENSYRVEFFRTDGENNRVPVRVQDIPDREKANIIVFLVTEFEDLGFYNIRFNGEYEDNPYGYIVLGDNPYNVIVREGDIDLEYVTDNNIRSLRITRM